MVRQTVSRRSETAYSLASSISGLGSARVSWNGWKAGDRTLVIMAIGVSGPARRELGDVAGGKVAVGGHKKKSGESCVGLFTSFCGVVVVQTRRLVESHEERSDERRSICAFQRQRMVEIFQ